MTAIPKQMDLNWIKARRSVDLNACVELAIYGDLILIRDSKNPGTHLGYTRLEIDAFLDGVIPEGAGPVNLRAVVLIFVFAVLRLLLGAPG